MTKENLIALEELLEALQHEYPDDRLEYELIGMIIAITRTKIEVPEG